MGAAVLVALAVIFLPMLFDGAGTRESLDAEITIPEQPEPPESQLDSVGGAELAAEPADSSAEGSTEPDAAASGSTDAPDAEDVAADDGGGDAEIASGWVVQVASFRQETNALVLRDRLRQLGFEAYSERARSGGKTFWRVRIGPVASREEGEALERRVEEQRADDALLLSYP